MLSSASWHVSASGVVNIGTATIPVVLIFEGQATKGIEPISDFHILRVPFALDSISESAMISDQLEWAAIAGAAALGVGLLVYDLQSKKPIFATEATHVKLEIEEVC